MSQISDLIRERITALSGTMTQREIAAAVGYPNPNIVSMHKRGTSKVPLEKIPAYARVLGVDVSMLFRLWLEQYGFPPHVTNMVAVVTPRERQWLDLIRQMEPA